MELTHGTYGIRTNGEANIKKEGRGGGCGQMQRIREKIIRKKNEKVTKNNRNCIYVLVKWN